MSFQTGSYTECLFSNTADHTAVASTASEASLLAGTNLQPTLYPSFFEGNRSRGRVFRVTAGGVFSTTGTPTITFQVRLGTTVGSTYLSGVSIAQSAAITTTSGVTNVGWQLQATFVCTVPGQGTTNTTISGFGFVESPAGFATPFKYLLVPSSGSPATWTSTFDNTLQQFLNLSLTWSASSSSNTATCKFLICEGLN